MQTTPVIEAIRLNKRIDFDKQSLVILDSVDLRVDAGDSLAILGASGSGKSTLLSLLAGLDQPSSGQIRLCGQELTELNEDQKAALRGQHLGFVFQSFQLLPDLTALENLMLPLELKADRDAEAKARHWLDKVRLGNRAQHLPSRLSGGEQQRIALARAFITDPALVLADEPTGNLDARTGQQIIELMFDLNSAQGTTLLLITHDERLAVHCQRQLYLAQGRLQESAA